MADDPRLHVLIDRWEELKRQGREVSPEELCRHSPDLLPAVRKWLSALKGTQWLEATAAAPAAKQAVAVQSKPRIRTLGDYEILSKIGAGGMGQVYKARHQRMDRIVALKVLPPAVRKDATAVKRFHQEVKAAARLDHPNIVAAYDAGESQGIHFLVLQYIDGRDLANLVKADGPLSVERTVDTIVQAARGLAYAHEQGIVHRDIKPANLLVDRKGTVKVLDMGLARIVESLGQHELTQSGQVLGTVDYMAPEQARNTHQADGRADMYSLGCTLYWLLTGQPMYPGDTIVQKLMAHQDEPIPPLRRARAEVPEALDAVYQRMVAKRPEDRYPTMHALIEALGIATPWYRRRSLLAGAAAAAAVLLVGLFGLVKSLTGSVPDGTPAVPAIAPFNASQARDYQRAWSRHLGVPLALENSLGMRLVLIPPGEFMQGATRSEIDPLVEGARVQRLVKSLESQLPQHRVQLTTPYRIGATEVTVSQFRAFVQAAGYQTDAERDGKGGRAPSAGGSARRVEINWKNPGHTQTDDCPVLEVSWHDAVEFCNWLSRHEHLPPAYAIDSEGVVHRTGGAGYRLPTEAEWEFACRAGTTSVYSWGNSPDQANDYAWHWENSGEATQRVGTKFPNAFGLFDMQGNAREVVGDYFSETYYAESPASDPQGPTEGDRRVLRGGAWRMVATFCRSAGRAFALPHDAHALNGFRISRDVEVQGTPRGSAGG